MWPSRICSHRLSFKVHSTLEGGQFSSCQRKSWKQLIHQRTTEWLTEFRSLAIVHSVFFLPQHLESLVPVYQFMDATSIPVWIENISHSTKHSLIIWISYCPFLSSLWIRVPVLDFGVGKSWNTLICISCDLACLYRRPQYPVQRKYFRDQINWPVYEGKMLVKSFHFALDCLVFHWHL